MLKRALQPLLWFCLLTSTLALASGLALSATSSTPQLHSHTTRLA